MQDTNPRVLVKTILRENGILILENPQKFQTIFFTLSEGKFKKECNGLIQSINEKIPFEMNKCNNTIPYEIYAPRYCDCLQEKYGLTKDLAIWTIESWAVIFGIIKDEWIDLETEFDAFRKCKHLWERGELPWSWWSTIGIKWEIELTRKMKNLNKKEAKDCRRLSYNSK